MTGISWADETWNPVIGCTPVSTGCAHCYAARAALRLERCGTARYEGLARPDLLGRPAWSGAVRCVPEALAAPFRWARRRHVFLGSMTDVFQEAVPSAFVDRIWDVMENVDRHTYLILTKRPERMRRWLEERWRRFPAAPRAHIWVGATIESAAHVDRLEPLLALHPRASTWLSLEPLLEPLADALGQAAWDLIGGDVAGFASWIVAGGESGPGARPMQAAWVRGVRDLCGACGIPFHFKQWGPRNAGRVLDGRTWDARPDPDAVRRDADKTSCPACGGPSLRHLCCRACQELRRRTSGAA